MNGLRIELKEAQNELNRMAKDNLNSNYRMGLSLVNKNIDKVLPVNTVVYNYDNFKGLKVVRHDVSEYKDIYFCKALEDTTLPKQSHKESVTVNMIQGESWNFTDKLPQLYTIKSNTDYELQFSKGSVFLLIFEPKISL